MGFDKMTREKLLEASRKGGYAGKGTKRGFAVSGKAKEAGAKGGRISRKLDNKTT